MFDTLEAATSKMEAKTDQAMRILRNTLEDIYRADALGNTGSAHKVKIPFVLLTGAGELRDVEITVNVSEKPHPIVELKTRLGGPRPMRQDEEEGDPEG